MSEPYIGEIRMFAGNYAPVGWAKCDGQVFFIVNNEVLFALIGTTYGGDGVNTFALPDLRGRIPVHLTANYVLGSTGGTETITLVPRQIPNHTHVPQVNANNGNSSDPSGQYWAANTFENFSPNVKQNLVNMSSQAIEPTGTGQPHDNLMPSLTVTFIIALQGLYPSQG